MLPLSPRTRDRVESLFAENRHEQVERLLINHCGNNLPFCEDKDEHQLERIRHAALKLSRGNCFRLREAVRLAKTDWRDLLVAAEGGS